MATQRYDVTGHTERLRELKTRAEHWREIGSRQTDAITECDGCHVRKPVWIDYDAPGDWAYCRRCLGQLMQQSYKEVHRLTNELAVWGKISPTEVR